MFDQLFSPGQERWRQTPSHLIGALLGMFALGLLLSPTAGAGTWPGANGRIAYEDGNTIWTINPDGSDEQELVTHPDGGDDPSWSPDGKWVAFSSERNSERDIYVIRADGTGEKQVTNRSSVEEITPSWVNMDKLVFKADDPLNADPFDGKIVTAEIGAGPTSAYAIVREPDVDGGGSMANPEISIFGSLTWTEWHAPEVDRRKTAVWTADGVGPANMVSINDVTANNSGWSPDGERVVYSMVAGSRTDVFIADPSGGNAVNVTQSPAYHDFNPRLSPDGKKVVADDNNDLYVTDIASGIESFLPTGPSRARDADWGIVPGTDPLPPPNEQPPPSGPEPDDSACRKATAALKKAKRQVGSQEKKVRKARRKVRRSSGREKRVAKKELKKLQKKLNKAKQNRRKARKKQKVAC